MYTLYSLFIISLPTAIALLPPRRPLAPRPSPTLALQQPPSNATNTTILLRAWPAVPFSWPVSENINLRIVRLQPQTLPVRQWVIETALLDIYTNITFFGNLADRLPSEIAYNSDNGEIDVIVEFFTMDALRTIRYAQARRIVNALWDMTAAYEPTQIDGAEVEVAGRVVSRLKMSFVPSIVLEGMAGGNATALGIETER